MRNGTDEIERFTASERAVHLLLFTSLIVLSITGLTLKYHESFVAQWIMKVEGGVLFRGKIHRLAALVLMGTFSYHLLAVLFSAKSHQLFHDMLFTRKDFRDFVHLVMHNLGIRKQGPLFGRFSCIEKVQYFATGLAAVLLGVSGLVLWFETTFMMLFPKWVVDLTHVVHSFEATIGFAVLVIWHMYNVHLNPEVFPMSRVWLTGRISREALRRDHPLEYQRLYGNNDVEK